MKNLKVKTIIDHFNLTVVHKGDILNNYVSLPNTFRVGDFFSKNDDFAYKKCGSVSYFGKHELDYINHLNNNQLKKCHDNVKNINIPLIILNSHFTKDQIAKIKKFFGNVKSTIAFADINMMKLNFIVYPWLIRQMTPTNLIHGSLVSIYGKGVLITGKSFCGKSESTVELVKLGHFFVADDAIEIFNFGLFLYGRPNNISKRYIEIRGIGIMDAHKVFGLEKILDETKIDLVINLNNMVIYKNDNIKQSDRFGNTIHYTTISGIKLPKYDIPVTSNRSVARLIEMAVIDYKLKTYGYNSGKNFLKNFKSILKKKKND